MWIAYVLTYLISSKFVDPKWQKSPEVTKIWSNEKVRPTKI